MNFNRYWIGLTILLTLSGATLAACDDENETPSEEEGDAGKGGKSGGKAGSGGKSGSAGSKAAGSGGSAGKSGSSGGGGKAGAGGSKSEGEAGKGGSGEGGDCEGDDGCYSCKPGNTEQFLNACTGATCNPYDNSKLTKLVDGKVPEVP
jgi:hypothetical protein